MSDEIQDIEKLIRQSGELSDSLIRLAQKLQERNRHQAQLHEERAQNRATLHRKLNDLSSHIDLVNNEIGLRQYYNQDEAYVKARAAIVDGTATPQEAAVGLLRVGVTDKSMSPDFAVEQLAKLLRPDLPVSRRIEIRETAKAAFEAGDDVLKKIKPFLKSALQNQQTREQQMGKTVAVTP
jgi:hypothetical protein